MQPQPDILCCRPVTDNGGDVDENEAEDEDGNEADDNTTGTGLAKTGIMN